MHKLNRMKPWEIPEDELGNAGWINLKRILEDESICLTLARLRNLAEQKELEQRVKDRIKSYIKQMEETDLIQKYKKYMPQK